MPWRTKMFWRYLCFHDQRLIKCRVDVVFFPFQKTRKKRAKRKLFWEVPRTKKKKKKKLPAKIPTYIVSSSKVESAPFIVHYIMTGTVKWNQSSSSLSFTEVSELGVSWNSSRRPSSPRWIKRGAFDPECLASEGVEKSQDSSQLLAYCQSLSELKWRNKNSPYLKLEWLYKEIPSFKT